MIDLRVKNARYQIVWPGDDDLAPAVAVMDPDGDPTMRGYSQGDIEDIFDVRLYGSPDAPGGCQEQAWYDESVAALRALVALANIGLDSLRSAS